MGIDGSRCRWHGHYDQSAAARVLHEQGVEKTTLADIARAAEVPVGNVYYYFKTKDQLVGAAIDAHAQQLEAMIADLDQLPTPQDRLKALIHGWVEQRELTARYGCPTGTLASELDKRADGLDRAIADAMGGLLDWVDRQFQAMNRSDSRELAVALVAAYQGISLLTNSFRSFRDPELMVTEGRRLERWIDSLAETPGSDDRQRTTLTAGRRRAAAIRPQSRSGAQKRAGQPPCVGS